MFAREAFSTHYGQLVRIYEGHAKARSTGAKKVENSYSRNVKLRSAIPFYQTCLHAVVFLTQTNCGPKIAYCCGCRGSFDLCRGIKI